MVSNEKKCTKIVNIIGGPGVGKSTVATGLFSKLKQRKISVEYVSEYAKEVTWEETNKLLENQIHVFSEQYRRQYRLLNKVDYVITDSPLILNSIYFDYYLGRLKEGEQWFSPEYQTLCRTFFDQTFLQFNNFNVVLRRKKDYDTNGRNQSLEEAKIIDAKIDAKINDLQCWFHIMNGTEEENIQKISEFI